jgi:hypothetical protein
MLPAQILTVPLLQLMTQSFMRVSRKSGFFAGCWVRFIWLLVFGVVLGGFYTALMWGMAISAIEGPEGAQNWLTTCISGVFTSMLISSTISLVLTKVVLPYLIEKYCGEYVAAGLEAVAGALAPGLGPDNAMSPRRTRSGETKVSSLMRHVY